MPSRLTTRVIADPLIVFENGAYAKRLNNPCDGLARPLIAVRRANIIVRTLGDINEG